GGRPRPASRSRRAPSGATGGCRSRTGIEDSHSATDMTLPNLLTMLRIFAAPLLVVVLLTPFSEDWVGVPQHIAGVTLFLLAAITDAMDGWLARRRKQISRLGILLDPIADKLLTSAAFISLVENR